MSNVKIAIVLGSTREGRFADIPGKWIADLAALRSDLEVEVIDLRDYPMPFFDEPASSAWVPSKNEIARKWQSKVGQFDGFIFTAAEYNHGPTAVLKNALDYAYTEWNRKPVGFIGYGSVGGGRSIEHLRLAAIELQMVPVRTAVHIAWVDYLAIKEGRDIAEFPHLGKSAADMLDQISWFAHALKTARNADDSRTA